MDKPAPPSKYLPYLVSAAFFMQLLDATILNTALPSIARDFGTDPLKLHSVVIAYVLTVAVLIPASGWISDWLGSRRVFIGSMILFTIGSVFCAASVSVDMLIVSRIIQGIGGAFLMPVGRLIILRSYPRNQFVRVMSLVTMPGLLGPLMGPLLGGFLVQYLSWHWIFLINIPVGILGVWAGHKCLPNLFAVEKQRFDTVGFILFSLSALLFSLSLETTGTASPPRGRMIFMLCAAALCLFTYWMRSRKVEAPLFSTKLFQTTTFAIGIVGNLVARIGGGAMPYLMPLFFQVVLGYSAFKSGLSMLPLALCSIAAKPMITPLLERFGYKLIMVINTVILGGLIMCFSLINPGAPEWWLLILLSAMGLANSIQFTCMNTLTLVDLPQKYASSGNSLLSVVMQFAVSFSIAIATMLLDEFMDKSDLPGAGAVKDAFHYTFVAIGLFSLLSAIIFAQIPRDKGRKAVSDANPAAA